MDLWQLLASTIVHWLGPPLFFLGWSEAKLAIWCDKEIPAIEGELSSDLVFYFNHFLSMVGLGWLRMGWQGVTSQEKIPWNTPPCPGIEPGPRRGLWDTFILSLKYHDWPWLTCYTNKDWTVGNGACWHLGTFWRLGWLNLMQSTAVCYREN